MRTNMEIREAARKLQFIRGVAEPEFIRDMESILSAFSWVQGENGRYVDLLLNSARQIELMHFKRVEATVCD